MGISEDREELNADGPLVDPTPATRLRLVGEGLSRGGPGAWRVRVDLRSVGVDSSAVGDEGGGGESGASSAREMECAAVRRESRGVRVARAVAWSVFAVVAVDSGALERVWWGRGGTEGLGKGLGADPAVSGGGLDGSVDGPATGVVSGVLGRILSEVSLGSLSKEAFGAEGAGAGGGAGLAAARRLGIFAFVVTALVPASFFFVVLRLRC